jgi:hypothetical protein
MLHLTLKRRKYKAVGICICENYAKQLIAKLYTKFAEIFNRKLCNNLQFTLSSQQSRLTYLPGPKHYIFSPTLVYSATLFRKKQT